ncbi:ATP-dependent RNA helicase drs1-like [Fagus crenata]
MRSLTWGPDKRAHYYLCYNVNGFRFRTKRRDVGKRTQNSGIMVRGEHQNGNVPFYGLVTDIVELHYTKGNSVVLFKCEWFDVAREGIGYKVDRHGITTINMTQKLNTQEPFVLACQAIQVYYVNCIKDRAWSVVVETKPRNLYEVLENEEEPYQEEEVRRFNTCMTEAHDEDDEINWSRNMAKDMVVGLSDTVEQEACEHNNTSSSQVPPSPFETPTNGETHVSSNSVIGEDSEGSTVTNKRGRGKAKGVSQGHNIECEIYDNRFTVSKVIGEIGVKFHQNIHGPWTNFSEYPKEQLDMLYECYKEAAFDHKNTELEVRKVFDDYIKRHYPDWMWHLRKDCFEKYPDWEDRYKHPLDDEKMETKKLEVESKGEVMNEKQIYFEVTRPPTRGHVLGMGAGIKPRDVYGITSSSQGCRKGCQEDRLKEKEEFEAHLKEIKDKRLIEKKEMEDMRLTEKKEMEKRITQMETQMPLMENVTGIKNGDHNANNDTKCDSEEDDSEKEESDSNQIEEIDSDDD